MVSVNVNRFRTDGRTECEHCTDLRPDVTRERARQHANGRDHTVRYTVEDVTVYTRKASK